jgi:acetyl/propionyl-CoA carboxylase alpha subunit
VAAIARVLVASRGEIAARIARTCRRLGITCVAVAAPDDAGAYHTRVADETVPIASYLDAKELARAAVLAGADAVHPGYGFLAESPVLAEAVIGAGLAWVGPPPAVLRAAGDKVEARRVASAQGVPTLPSGTADEIGFPLIVKAAGGGGGRGMRVVRSADELEPALETARREAQAGFGDGTTFLERFVERPRHVEIQLLADAHGACISLGERECSIQRRHQKLLEESPSPALDDELRARMADAAVAIASAIGYAGAGTAEFLLEGNDFFFLELNARIQVEHPVTELVTGLDLVEEQLRVTAGEPLHRAPVARGHAVEVRLYAEHPVTFLPQEGRIERLVLPEGVRVGVEEGDAVPVAYDPLLAKLVAHGESREESLEVLSAALRETAVGGVTTNLALLRWLAAHPEVRAGRTTTAFLVDYPPLSRVARPREPWTGGFRLNGEPRGAAPPPTVEATSHAAARDEDGTEVRAAMPGIVIRVVAREGDRVGERGPLVVLEAMKMEMPVLSPFEAIVRRIHVSEGDRVRGGELLVELTI